MKLVVTTAALAVAIATLGCSKDKEPATPATAETADKSAFEEVGGAVGGAAEDVGGAVKEGAIDTAEYSQIEGTQRFECENGQTYSVDYKNDGRSARITKDDRQYWFDLQSGGQFGGKDGKYWTTGKDMASLQLTGQPPLENCKRK